MSNSSARLCDLVSGLFVRFTVSNSEEALSWSDLGTSVLGGLPGFRCAPVGVESGNIGGSGTSSVGVVGWCTGSSFSSMPGSGVNKMVSSSVSDRIIS